MPQCRRSVRQGSSSGPAQPRDITPGISVGSSQGMARGSAAAVDDGHHRVGHPLTTPPAFNPAEHGIHNLDPLACASDQW